MLLNFQPINQNKCMIENITDFVKEELISFTGLTRNEVEGLICSKKHKNEWLFWDPKTETQINWFYKSSISYLFTNSIHVLHPNIINDIPEGSTIFDFGGGTGNYSYYLINKKCKCVYFDISFLQRKFVEYVVNKNNLPISIVNYDEDLIPIYNEKVDFIIALDVIEHIPNYEKYIKYFSNIVKSGGGVYVYAPFSTVNDPTHLDDKYELNKVMGNYGFYFVKNIKLNPVANCGYFERKL